MSKFTIQYDPNTDKGRDLQAIVLGGDYWVIVTDNFEAKNAVAMLAKHHGQLSAVCIEAHIQGDGDGLDT